jgi:hypothetical protein
MSIECTASWGSKLPPNYRTIKADQFHMHSPRFHTCEKTEKLLVRRPALWSSSCGYRRSSVKPRNVRGTEVVRRAHGDAFCGLTQLLRVCAAWVRGRLLSPVLEARLLSKFASCHVPRSSLSSCPSLGGTQSAETCQRIAMSCVRRDPNEPSLVLFCLTYPVFSLFV